MKKLLIVLFLLLASVQAVDARSGDMDVTDIFAKMGNGDRLSPGEQNQLAMWVADMENVRGYVAGLHAGTSDIHANKIYAHQGDFDNDTFASLHATALSGGYMSWNSDYVVIPSVGFLEYRSADPTKIFLTPQALALFEATRFRFLVNGYAVSTASVAKTVTWEWYNSSDILVDAQTLVASTDSATMLKTFVMAFPTVDTDLTTVSYFKISYSGGTFLVAEVFIKMV